MRWPTNAKRANASDEYVAGVEGRRTTERQGARHQQEAGHGSHAQDGLLGMSAGFLCAAAWYCVIDHSFTLPSRLTSKFGLHPVLVPFLPIEMWSARVRLLTADTKKARFFCPHQRIHAYNVTNSFSGTRIDIVVCLWDYGDTGSVALTATMRSLRWNIHQRSRNQGLCVGTKACRKLPKR